MTVYLPPLQFADSGHWLRYFPPLAVRDLKAMGCGIDWRRRQAGRGCARLLMGQTVLGLGCVGSLEDAPHGC